MKRGWGRHRVSAVSRRVWELGRQVLPDMMGFSILEPPGDTLEVREVPEE